MKSLLLTAALTGVSFASSAFATTPLTPSAAKPASAPRPIPAFVVQPEGLPLGFTRSVVNIEFSLDASGQPQEIKVLSVKDPILKQTLVDAFRQWRFSPGAADAASGKRYVLPLDLRAEA